MNKRISAMVMAMVMAISGACGAAAEAAYATPAPMMADTSRITVQGTAQVNAAPDIASVTANASVTAGSVGSAQEEMASIVAMATDKLLALGVLDDDIVTSNYSHYQRYNYDTNTITGYEVNHTLVITCRDVEMIDSVISALTDSGFAQIYSVDYDVSTRSELYQQAIDLAIQRAEAKALRIAQTSGLTITGIASITENGSEGYMTHAVTDSMKLRSESAAGIRSGMVGVNASVSIVYDAAK